MRLILYKLPQLAVSAKILCLLMVMMTCGVVPSMVHSMRLYSKSSSRFLEIYPNGSVLAKGEGDPKDPKQDLRIISVDDNLITGDWNPKILIWAPGSKRYLCFDERWRLRGLNITILEAGKLERCMFYEELSANGHNLYRSAVRTPQKHYMCFRKNGHQMRKCAMNLEKNFMYFINTDDVHKNLIDHHNKKLADVALSHDEPHHDAPRVKQAKSSEAKPRRGTKKKYPKDQPQKHRVRHHRGQKHYGGRKYHQIA